jgi:NAD(P)-dependent dehydrogenase (short-subunit alcohol dehydrogenase family)
MANLTVWQSRIMPWPHAHGIRAFQPASFAQGSHRVFQGRFLPRRLFMSDPRQTPTGSPFGARSTAAKVAAKADLSGKTVVITGGYSGIGLEAAKALAGAGARLIVPGRSPDKARAALDGLDATVVELDLSEPDSIKAGAEAIRAEAAGGIDILINNAGIMAGPLRRNSKGWESQFATNHLGHFALFAQLKDLLLKAPGSRVVALSSLAHRISDVKLDDWNWEAGEYEKWPAYGRSKSANALFALELNARHEDKGLKAYSVHPGGIMTELQRDLPEEEMRAMGWIDEAGTLNKVFKSVEGASTTVWAATSPLLEDRGGVYCEDCDVAAPPETERSFSGYHPHIRDRDSAARLWALSETLTGLTG